VQLCSRMQTGSVKPMGIMRHEGKHMRNCMNEASNESVQVPRQFEGRCGAW
jgi:hypothetical protein